MENTSSIIQDILDAQIEIHDLNWHLQLLSLIDYTTLEGSDTTAKISSMCQKIKHIYDITGTTVAAICVYPPFIKQAKYELKGYPVNVASVAAGFPSGQTDISIKKAEVHFCVESGADEIDCVISRGKFLENNLAEVEDELKVIKQIAGNCTLKTILETGELETTKNIALASKLAIASGANFIKTSTGKAKLGATLLAHYTMMQEIKRHFEATNNTIGMKPSGGITTTEEAANYLAIAEYFMGKDYIKNTTFRIGASSLLNNVLKKITELKPEYAFK